MRVSRYAESVPRDIALYGWMTQIPELTRHRLLADIPDCDHCKLAAESLDLQVDEPNKYSLIIPGICLAARLETLFRCVRGTSLREGLTAMTKPSSRAIKVHSNQRSYHE